MCTVVTVSPRRTGNSKETYPDESNEIVLVAISFSVWQLVNADIFLTKTLLAHHAFAN